MRKIVLGLAVLAFSVSGVLAADNDPIATRKALMDANGAAAAVAGGMLKGDIGYNPVVAKAAIAAMNGVSHAYGAFFPETSKTGERTKASPKIWQDMAGFQAQIAKFQTNTIAAVKASGKTGPADLKAFKAAVGPIFANCKSCHETYRLK